MSGAKGSGTGSGTAPDPSFSGTSIDLADDLLKEGTLSSRAIESGASKAPVAPLDVGDELASARILLNEGMPEEAKKTLRRVLIAEPEHLEARKMLAEIHDLELKQIFGNADAGSAGNSRREDRVPPELILESLDQDLGLDLFGVPELPPKVQLAFDQHLAELSAKDLCDVGIAFHEMGAYELAIQAFQSAARDSAHYLDANCLLASAYIAAGRPFDATLALEPLIEDGDLERESKVELMYLMGRAFERMGKPDLAHQWYRQAAEIDPTYRDVDDRLSRMGLGLGLGG